MKRTAFFISDSTGITAETLGKSLLNQFDTIDFNQVIIPYVDSAAKAEAAVSRINQVFDNDGVQPIVFDTVINPEIRDILSGSRGYMMDILSTFLVPLEKVLGAQSSYRVGKVPGATTNDRYVSRINAVHYALDNDDGARVNHYDKADLILIGVSRSGKTPSCLYLAMQFGIFAANYPITEEDLESSQLPKSLAPYKEKLFGLTIEPERLCAIRSERKANSRYASLSQCEFEIRGVEAMLRRNNIPLVNTTDFSVEEIAARILNETGIDRRS